jgi:twitching motility protein PilT
LPADVPPLDRLGLPGEVSEWLQGRGLIVVAGPSGSGKTTTLGALIRALGERKRNVVSIEDPIEIVHGHPWISQRAVGEHVESIASGVKSAMREAAEAIVIGAVDSAEGATAVIDAITGGHLVLTTLVVPAARVAIERLIDHLPTDQRELARALCADSLLGTIAPIVGRGGTRTFEVAGRGRAP